MPLEFIKTGGLASADYKDSLEVVVSDPVLAVLPNGDPLKRSKKIALGALPTKFVDWDVTPSIAEAETVLALAQPHQMDIGPDGDLSLNYAGAPAYNSESPPTFWGGAVRTNVDLSTLVPGVALHLGYEITSVVPSYAPFILGFVLADPNKTSADVVADVLAGLVGTTEQITHASILSLVPVYGTQKQTNIGWTIPNDVNPLFADAAGMLHVKNQPLLANLDLGSKVLMILGRDTNGISIANINVAPNGATYDITDADQIINNPVLPADTTLFYFMIGLDLGQGYPVISIKPTVTAPSPSYDVTGTTYNTTHAGTNGTWAALFPNPITTPISTVVTQAVFPITATVGRGLRAIIAPTYTDPYPAAPYGITVTNGTKCIVDDITPGTEDFTALVDTDGIAALTATVTQTQSQLTALSTAMTTSARAASMGEIILYVRAPTDQSSEVPIPAGPTVFDTFDLAYTYALTLPKTLRKRLVLDDRVYVTYTGIVHAAVDGQSPTTFKLYELLANNITLSSYQIYNGTMNIVNDALYVNLQFRCDGLRVIDFAGRLSYLLDSLGTQYPMFDIATGVIAPNGLATEDNLIIGPNALLTHDSNAIAHESGGTVYIADGGSWLLTAYTVSLPAFTASVNIYKSTHGKLTLQGNVPALANNGSYAFNVFMPHGSSQPYIGSGLTDAVSISYTDAPLPARFVYGNYRIIQSVSDFLHVLNFDNTGRIALTSDYTYFIVGSVDLSVIGLSVSDMSVGKIKILGLPGSELISTGVVLYGGVPHPTARNEVDITGVNIITRSLNQRAIEVWVGLSLMDLTVESNAMLAVLSYDASPVESNVIMRRTRFIGVNDGPIESRAYISVHGVIDIDDVYVKANNAIQAFQLDVKEISSNPKHSVRVNDLDVLFVGTDGGPAKVIDLNEFRYGGINDYAVGQIQVTNVHVAFDTVSPTHEWSLFSILGYSAYDASTDVAITTDQSRAYLYNTTNNHTVAPLSFSDVAIPFGEISGAREFVNVPGDANTMRYIGKRGKLFHVTLNYGLKCTVNGITVTIKVNFNGSSVAHTCAIIVMGAVGERYSGSLMFPVSLLPQSTVSVSIVAASSCNVTFDTLALALTEL